MKLYKLAALALILGILAIMPGCVENECDLTGPDGCAEGGPTGTLRLLLTDRPLDALSIDVTTNRVDAVPAGDGGPFTVVGEEQSFDLLTPILLDFDARESVVERRAGMNRFLLKPVIHVKNVEINHPPVAGDGIYDLVLTRSGYAPVIVEGVSVTAGQTVDVGTLTLTPRTGIFVYGAICQPAPLPVEMRLLAPSTGELVYLGLMSVQSTGVFGFTLPEGAYDLMLSAGERSPLVVEDILIERDESDQCELTYGENHHCFPL